MKCSLDVSPSPVSGFLCLHLPVGLFLVISGSLPDRLPLLGDSVNFASGLIHKCGKGEGAGRVQWPSGKVQSSEAGTGADLMGSKKIRMRRHPAVRGKDGWGCGYE